MSYHQKIERKLTDLQKGFFRLFRKKFPELAETIEIEEKKSESNSFCFSIRSNCDVFGQLYFAIDDTEITVYTEFDHCHFPTYQYDQEKNRQRRIQLTCLRTLEYIKDFVNGDVIVEYEQKGDTILRAKQYYKGSITPFAATIILSKDGDECEPRKKTFISRIKSIFGHKNDEPKAITKKVNWFGEIN